MSSHRYQSGGGFQGGGGYPTRGRGSGDYRGGRSGGDFRGGRGGGGGDFRGGRGGGPPLIMPNGQQYKRMAAQKMLPGKTGRPIQLLTNFYNVIIGHVTFIHYDLEISFDSPLEKKMQGLLIGGDPSASKLRQSSSDSEGNGNGNTSGNSGHSKISGENLIPDRFQRLFGGDLLMEFAKQYPNKINSKIKYVFDGEKNLYTVEPLLSSGRVSGLVKFMINGRQRDFIVRITHVGTIPNQSVHEFYEKADELAEQFQGGFESKLATIYDVFFKFLILQTHEQFRNKFFNTKDVQEGRSRIVSYVQGFIKSVKPTEFGLGFNIHLKTSCIISSSMTKLPQLVLAIVNERRHVTDNLDGFSLSLEDLSRVKSYLKHLKVFTEHTGRQVIYTCTDLTRFTVKSAFFDKKIKDGSSVKMSIYDYFLDTYQIRLKNMHLLLTTNNKMIPIELCTFYNSQFLSHQKMSSQSNIQQELLFKSTHTPDVYMNKVQKIVDDINRINPSLCQAFGVKLVNRPAYTMGRVLDPPIVLPGKQRGFTPFKTPASSISDRRALNFAFFSFDTTIKEEQMKAFSEELVNAARNYNLQLQCSCIVPTESEKKAEAIINTVGNAKKHIPRLELLLAIIPMRTRELLPTHIYNTIKMAGEKKYNLMTQCMKGEILNRLPSGYCDNILMKINAKLNGQNSVLESSTLKRLGLDPSETMMCGIDLNKASPRDDVSCSVVALVGSIDEEFSRYTSSVRVQQLDKNDLACEIDQVMTSLLKEYERINGRRPKNIIFFRDGLSDAQIEKIKDYEMPQIRKALSSKSSKNVENIKMLWIVVLKRCHTRFMLTEQDTSLRRPSFNVPSGTVIDQDIVDPTKYPNFYLNSHFSALGTGRPSRYVVVHDDLNMTFDNIQRLCFYMCYNCVRTNNVLAVPVPIRYADLCAYRSKLYIEQAFVANYKQFHSEQFSIDQVMAELQRVASNDPAFRNRLYFV